jgi:hypothetical protein
VFSYLYSLLPAQYDSVIPEPDGEMREKGNAFGQSVSAAVARAGVLQLPEGGASAAARSAGAGRAAGDVYDAGGRGAELPGSGGTARIKTTRFRLIPFVDWLREGRNAPGQTRKSGPDFQSVGPS